MALLDSINSSADIKKLDIQQLTELAGEIRAKITETVSKTGGHLASNLGVVELTLAVHHCFDFPNDRIVFDVGHQCYVHKLITGRREEFHTLRQRDGISGFPSVDESPYDQFDVGHAGTAIPTAVGLAHGDQLAGRSNRIVAVVGDASIVNGVSLEGLNNAAMVKRQLLLILNDNSMAIDVTQGGFAKYLNRLRFTHTYEDLKRKATNLLDYTAIGRSVLDSLNHLKQGVKTALAHGQIFEQLGTTYLGPIDGHDLGALIRALDVVKDAPYPIVLHVQTEKGRGSKFAASDPCAFHSPSGFEINGDDAVVNKGDRDSFTSVFGRTLVKMAEADEKIVAITAAMPDGTGLVEFKKRFPDRYFDVGICESAAVDIAAGMAKAGYNPVVAIYSTFLQRAFDQVWQEIVLQGLPITLAIDRAGLVGADGAVHHGFADLAFLQVLPNMVCCAPADAAELESAIEFAVTSNKAVAIRYPRDVVPEPITPTIPFESGKARVVREGNDAVVLAYGWPVTAALQAANMLVVENIDVGVVSARFAKPLDEELIGDLLETGKPIVIAEDHSITAGFGSAVIQFAQRNKLPIDNVYHVGIPADKLIPHGSRAWQLSEAGLDAHGIAETLKAAIGIKPDQDPRIAARLRIGATPPGRFLKASK